MTGNPPLPRQADGIADYPIKDFYLTNAICRASPTMQRCSSELVHGEHGWRQRNEGFGILSSFVSHLVGECAG